MKLIYHKLTQTVLPDYVHENPNIEIGWVYKYILDNYLESIEIENFISIETSHKTFFSFSHINFIVSEEQKRIALMLAYNNLFFQANKYVCINGELEQTEDTNSRLVSAIKVSDFTFNTNKKYFIFRDGHRQYSIEKFKANYYFKTRECLDSDQNIYYLTTCYIGIIEQLEKQVIFPIKETYDLLSKENKQDGKYLKVIPYYQTSAYCLEQSINHYNLYVDRYSPPRYGDSI